MAKTYIDTVKYMVHGNLEIGGMVEKPDVVGALFGQTEGLLGDELDLRELQKNGRIGRIEVDLQPRAGKSIGRIMLPSSLDMVETSILAAALEAVDRVGPYDARIRVEKIEDTRSVKRKAVVERAKELLRTLLTTEIPESKEISEMVRQEVKVSEIGEYGPEKMPAGPGVRTSDAIIVVEGRADVLNLLKNNMDNAVAIGGANVPKSLAGLCKEKEVTLFLDGDRGGDIILKELMSVAEIDYVARAPAGKEVEELARKEIIKALRSRVPIEQVEGAMKRAAEQQEARDSRFGFRGRRFDQAPSPMQQGSAGMGGASGMTTSQGGMGGSEQGQYRSSQAAGSQMQPQLPPAPAPSYGRETGMGIRERDEPRPVMHSQAPAQTQSAPARFQQSPAQHSAPAHSTTSGSSSSSSSSMLKAAVDSGATGASAKHEAAPAAPMPNVPQEFYASLDELENTARARVYDQAGALKSEILVKDMLSTIESGTGIHAVVFDGVVTQRLADLAAAKGVKILLGVKAGNIFKRPAGVFIGTKK